MLSLFLVALGGDAMAQARLVAGTPEFENCLSSPTLSLIHI